MIGRLTSHARFGLIAPFAALALVVLVHAIYWVIVAGGVERRALAWIAEQEAAGYDVSHAGLRVGGYPFRFSVRVAEPRIAAPATEGGWTAELPRLAVSAQIYDLRHWIAALDGPARIAAQSADGEAVYRVGAEAARLSLAGSDGATTRLGATLEGLIIEAEVGPAPSISAVRRVVLSGVIDSADRLAFRLQAEDMLFGAQLVPDGVDRTFGRTASLLRVDALLAHWSALAAAGDPFAWTGAGGRLEIGAAQLVWGPAELAGAGDITLDDALRPEGRLSLVVTDPDTLITALVASGLVHDEQGEALRLFALMAPRRESGIALPFRLQDGGLFLGPARIGSVGAVD